MGIRRCFKVALACALLGIPQIARPQSASSAPTLLATGHLASVVELPLFFRLYRVHLPTAQRASYEGSSTMLYDLSGAAAVDAGGGAVESLAEGAGAFIAAGQPVMISAAASQPAELLLFILTARPNERRPLFERPAVVQELFRTSEPLQGLKTGPYEFSFVRRTFPADTPANPPHYRSGAALDYVLAGSAAVTADEKTEEMSPETPFFEGFGWVHQLANPGSSPLVLLQATISREGEPPVVPAPAK